VGTECGGDDGPECPMPPCPPEGGCCPGD
jgi:hypothetical protein